MKRVLVAPLDWGLGHATRCIHVIHELINRNCEVWIASSGSALKLLQQEFPQLPFIELVSYRAKYSKSWPLMLSVFWQLPKFLVAVWKEHYQIQKVVEENKVELIISDNRYGCWSTHVPCIFITHQTNIQMSGMLKLLQPVVNFFNHQFINKFSRCWIPDVAGDKNLTGILSATPLKHARYIGILSRFHIHDADEVMKYDLAIILSGPEPQRTIIEETILEQLRTLNDQVIVVRGVIENEILWRTEKNITIVNYLHSEQLEKVMTQSRIILSRSGYSTIMDLARLKKQAILIPTPGQTEQEYLAKRLMEQGICFSVSQNNFNLQHVLKQSTGYKGFANIELSNQLLPHAIDEALTL
jgi:uncharacterized protein (TIGR00661 family)